MSKRQSEESRIVTYFGTANLSTAQAIFGIVKDIIKKRSSMDDPVAKVVARRRRGPNKARVNAGPGVNDTPTA